MSRRGASGMRRAGAGVARDRDDVTPGLPAPSQVPSRASRRGSGGKGSRPSPRSPCATKCLSPRTGSAPSSSAATRRASERWRAARAYSSCVLVVSHRLGPWAAPLRAPRKTCQKTEPLKWPAGAPRASVRGTEHSLARYVAGPHLARTRKPPPPRSSNARPPRAPDRRCCG